MSDVKQATILDAQHVAEMGMKFIDAAGMPEGNYSECLEFAKQLITSFEGVAFWTPAGVIGGVIAPLFYRQNYLQSTELFWYAEDRSGIDLLEAFEDWSFAKGARRINIASLSKTSPKALTRMLRMRGYDQGEISFTRTV